ncbi:MAG TPA: hypothetical protein VMY42_04220 [Thermoguttaceae bacterium]|nr:hypothetical protein [Thermoguttaceae bacterium]
MGEMATGLAHELNQPLTTVVTLVKSDFRHANIAVRIDVDSSLPAVLADKIQIDVYV